MKKIISVLLALVMTLALSVSALAAGEGSITISNPVENETYKVYLMFELESYNTTANAYSYKITENWREFVTTGYGKDYFNVDTQGYVTQKTGEGAGTDIAALAKAALEYAKSKNLTPAATLSEGNYTASNLTLGYYLIDSSLGTLCSLDTTNPTVTIKEKNAEPTNVKTVQEDSTGNYGDKNDADIGQTVNFQSTITAQAGAENYVFHDKMSSGLTYTGVTSVTLNGTTVATSNYEVKTTDLTDGCTFEVQFTQAFCDTLKANDKIVISYTATVNEDAVIGSAGNPNESKVSYGEKGQFSTVPSETKTYTWDVDILKYTVVKGENGAADTEKPLSGAVFTLSKNSDGTNPIALIKVKDNVYRVAKTGETGITEITTDETGTFTIEGLDSDTYYLIEKTAPAGYNTLKEPVTITISSDGKVNVTTENPNGVDTVKVLNQSGTELPSTGGIGTTIFYVLGGVLMAGAFVLLVVRKRMRTE